MVIVVVSDTHVPMRAEGLPPEVAEAMDKAELVLHAGDFTSPELLESMARLPRFVAVAGNMDGPQVRGRLRDLEIIELEGVRIGLTHGWGPPGRLPRMLRQHLAGEGLDAIVFGHSHQPFNERIDGVLLFNPGSPTDDVFAPYRSYGLLTIEDGALRGEIVQIGRARKP